MSETASNQDKAIVTAGTAHVAQNAGTTDLCVNPAVSPPTKLFKNSIPSTDLKAGKTRNTLIAGHAIMTARTKIGPSSSGDEDPYTLGSASGQPYNNWAKAAAWSSDVKAEGYWIIRTDDTTQQNANNSSGTMDGSALGGDETTVADFAKLKCTMSKLEGTSGEAKKLWKKSETATQLDYIEILTGEEVSFVSERIDATDVTGEPTVDPTCELVPKHTIWRIQRTGGSQPDKSEEEDGKSYVLDSDFTGIGGSWDLSGSLAQGTPTTLAQGATPRGVRKEQESSTVAASVDMGALRAYLRFLGSPCMIRVDAVACAGPKTAWVRLFPADPIKASFELGMETQDTTSVSQSGRNDFIDAIYDKFGKFRGLCNKIATIVGCAGDIEFGFKIFEGFKLEFELGYKHCTKTLTTRSGDWRSLEAHVGLAWSLKISADTLIGFSVTVKIPVVALAAAFFTGPGASVVVRVLRKIEDIVGEDNFRFDLEFTAAISVGLVLDFSSDQHDEASASGTIELKPTLTIALVLVVAGAEARAGGTLSGSVTIGATTPPPTHFMRLTSTGTLTFKVWVEGKVSGRVLWIGPRYEFSGRKEFEVFKWKMWEGGTNLFTVGRRVTS